jgi:hypothetical protein
MEMKARATVVVDQKLEEREGARERELREKENPSILPTVEQHQNLHSITQNGFLKLKQLTTISRVFQLNLLDVEIREIESVTNEPQIEVPR